MRKITMARIEIKTIKQIEKERNTVHTKVDTTYTCFEFEGKKYVQIDTYGRSGREIPGKISQSIQLDRASAEYLVKLLVDEFDLICSN